MEGYSLFSSEGDYIGMANVLSEKDSVFSEDGDTQRRELVVRVDTSDLKEFRKDGIVSVYKDAIRECWNIPTCSCTGDCCGCWFGGIVGGILYKDGLYSLKTIYHKNI